MMAIKFMKIEFFELIKFSGDTKNYLKYYFLIFNKRKFLKNQRNIFLIKSQFNLEKNSNFLNLPDNASYCTELI